MLSTEVPTYDPFHYPENNGKCEEEKHKKMLKILYIYLFVNVCLPKKLGKIMVDTIMMLMKVPVILRFQDKFELHRNSKTQKLGAFQESICCLFTFC